MAKKDRRFKNVTKISEIKNINGILCAVLGVVAVGALVMGTIEIKQQKRLDELEERNKPIEQQMDDYKHEIRSQFSKYIQSDQFKEDFKEKTGISEVLYQALEDAGLVPQLRNEDLNEIIDLAEQLLKDSPKMAGIDSIIYQDLYNELYKKVLANLRNNIDENQTITIEQRAEYDIDKIIAEVESKINKNIPSSKNTSEAITKSYIEGVVNTILKEYEISDSDMKYLRNKISKDVISFLNSDEGKKLYPNGKDGKDGKNGKDGKDGIDGTDGINGTDGKEIIKGIDYFTKEDIREITEILTELLADYINNGDITVKGEKGYSVIDIQRNKSIITVTSRRNADEVQTNSVTLPEIPSIESITYTEHKQNNDISYTGKDAILSVKYKDMATDKYKTENISVNTLSNAVTNSIVVNILEILHDYPLNNDIYFDMTTGKAYCRLCSTFDENGKLTSGVEAVFSNNETTNCITDDYYQCLNVPEHKYHKITIDNLKAELNEMLQMLKNLPIPGESDDSDNISDKKDQVISNLLAQYESLLDSMNSQYYYNTIMQNPNDIPYLEKSDVKTIFEYYDKVMVNVGGRNYYGTGEDLTSKITTYNTIHPVIVGYLLDKGYIVENTETMELNFAGNNDHERLNNAFDSKLIELFESLSGQVYNYDDKILAPGEQETNKPPQIDGVVEKEFEEILEIFKMIENIYTIIRDGIVNITVEPGSVLNQGNKQEIIYTPDMPMPEKQTYDYLSALYFHGFGGNPQTAHALPLEVSYAGDSISMYSDDKLNEIHGKLSGINGAVLEKLRDASGNESYKLTIYKDNLVNIDGLEIRISVKH